MSSRQDGGKDKEKPGKKTRQLDWSIGKNLLNLYDDALVLFTEAESRSKEEPAPLEDSKPEVLDKEQVEEEAA